MKQTLQMGVETNATDGCGKIRYRWVGNKHYRWDVETNITDGCGNIHNRWVGNKHYRWVWKQTLQLGMEPNGNKHYKQVLKQTKTNTTDGCGNKREQTLQMGVDTNGNKRYRWTWKQTLQTASLQRRYRWACYSSPVFTEARLHQRRASAFNSQPSSAVTLPAADTFLSQH